MARKPLEFNLDSSPLTPIERIQARDKERVKMTAHIRADLHRQLKSRAALQGESVQSLLEQAITQFLGITR